jgi:hypothetical protein
MFRITWNMDITSAFGLNGEKTGPVGWSQDTSDVRTLRKISNHFEYIKKQSSGLDVTWQPVRRDITMQP